jgi:hypothetical protein
LGCIDHPLSVVRIQAESLSQQLHKHLESSIGVLEKTFASPGFPPKLKKRQDLAVAMQYVLTAGSAYLAGMDTLGAEFLGHAVELAPELQRSRMDLLVTRFVNYFRGLSQGELEKRLLEIVNTLPGPERFSKKLRKEILGKYYVDEAFRAYQLEQYRRILPLAYSAVRWCPRYLRNRGLLVISAKGTSKGWLS